MFHLLACLHHPPAAEAFSGWDHAAGGAEGYGTWDTWCTGAPACADVQPQPGLRRRALQRGPTGATYEAVDVPADGGWGIAYAHGVGPTVQLRFLRYVGAVLTDQLSLGNPSVFQIEQTTIEVPATPSPSVEAQFEVWALGQLDALEAKATAELAGGRVQRCGYHRYLGDGSPICDPVLLPPAEQAAWTARVRAELGRARGHIKEDGRALFALLVTVKQDEARAMAAAGGD